MNTQLIYVSKEKAEVKDETTGTFQNVVSQGVKVKVGDLVSVEGIAINSIGVGSDIIEVPKSILNYNYEPNSIQLNCWAYIHQNYEYTCRLPFTNAAIDTTSISNAYGYLLSTAATCPAYPFSTGTSSVPFPLIMPGQDNYGERLYVGRYTAPIEAYDPTGPNLPDGQNPPVFNIPGNTPAVNVPGGFPGQDGTTYMWRVWCPLRTDMECKVDVGYDNPDNIANKITADMHSALPTPFFYTSTGANTAEEFAYESENRTETGNFYNQLACSTKNSSTLLVRGNPTFNSPFEAPAVAQATNFNFNSWLAVSNPMFLFYGSRLTSGMCLKNNTFINARAGIINAVGQSQIVNLLAENVVDVGPPAQDGWDNGSVLVSNLAYTEFNLKMVQKYIHNTKVYAANNVDKDDITTAQLNSPQVRREFVTPLDISRDNDSRPQTTSYRIPVQSNFRIAAEVSPAPQNCNMYTFFRQFIYEEYHLPTEAALFAGFEIDESPVLFEGENQIPKTIAEKLDILVCCVNTGTAGTNEKVIGFIRINQNLQSAGGNPPTTANGGSKQLSWGNYVVVNLAHQNPRCRTSMIVNVNTIKDPDTPPVAADFDGLVNLGAPNITCLFDSTRGRFALNQMSWADYTEATLNSAGTAVETTGGQEVITANHYNGGTFGTAGSTPDGITKAQGYKYAQSGLGVVDLSVKNKSSGEWEVIDYTDDNDIQNKFNNSLWERLGFVYKEFINKNGQPTYIYTERTHNSTIRRPPRDTTFFPFPITTNAQFDTAISISLDVGIASVNAPKFSLGTERGQPNIAITSESANLYASNLPQKLEYPYWLIQSDIIEGCKFSSENNGSEDNILALCNRAYVSGDFAFSFAPDYKFTATKDYVITGIKTRILNPDLTPANVSDKTSVIYKVESPIPMFTNQVKPSSLQKDHTPPEKTKGEQHSPQGQ
mgnify:FL=1|tara:strand:+ start:431 stop:3244 length:2814 start_codon:yes stop_codon:yes gene_type:complete